MLLQVWSRHGSSWQAGRQKQWYHPHKSRAPAMHRDLQAGHQEGLALGFLMKKCEGTCRAGVEMRGQGMGENGNGSAT